MNDESATSAIDEITRLVTRYAEGFAGDPLATIEFYALPMIYVGPDAVSVIGTREERSLSSRASWNACGQPAFRAPPWSAAS
jgi:hypothetical protein